MGFHRFPTKVNWATSRALEFGRLFIALFKADSVAGHV
jgi:hypothetical protein